MSAYQLSERQDIASQRQPEPLAATTLNEAKAEAEKAQFFKGTVLAILSERTGALIAHKSPGNGWQDCY
jgi:hypothetical protein